MKYSMIATAGAMLLAGSMSVYAQTQPRQEPETNMNRQQQSGQSSEQEMKSQKQGAEDQSGSKKVQSGQRREAGDTQRDAQREGGDKAQSGGDAEKMKRDAQSQERGEGDRRDRAESDKSGSGDMNKQQAEQKSGKSKAKQREASRKLQPKQKTVIKETIVKRNVRPAKVNFNVSIGTAVPRTVVLYDLPPVIVEVAPDYSGYKYVLADDNTIVVIDPDTWEIVDIIEI